MTLRRQTAILKADRPRRRIILHRRDQIFDHSRFDPTQRTGMNYWLIMLIPYFGRWPAWINLFVASCKANPRIRWRFYTNCGEPENKSPNVDYVHISFEDYNELVSDYLGLAFKSLNPF